MSKAPPPQLSCRSFTGRARYSILSPPRNEKLYCQRRELLCINTDDLSLHAAHDKSYMGDSGRRSQLETDRGGKWKERRTRNKKASQFGFFSVQISAKLMCLTGQELSELTAKCNLTASGAPWTQLLGLQFHWTLSNLFSWQRKEIKISLKDLTWQLTSLRFGAPTVTNLTP